MSLFSVQVIIDTERGVWLVCAVICLPRCRRGQSASFGQMSCIMISKEGWLRKREAMHRKTKCENLSTVFCVGFGATFFSWWHHMSSDDVDIMCVGFSWQNWNPWSWITKAFQWKEKNKSCLIIEYGSSWMAYPKTYCPSFKSHSIFCHSCSQADWLRLVRTVTFILLILLFFVL